MNNHTLSLRRNPDDAMLFIQYAVRKFPGIWKNTSSNSSGMRAAFRRWHPDSLPSVEMRQHVWNLIFKSMYDTDDVPLDGKSAKVSSMQTLLALHTDTDGNISNELAQLVDYISMIVGLRAVAGEHAGERASKESENAAEQQQEAIPRKHSRSLGHALYEAEMTDLRFVRLMTTPGESRVEALHRALRLLAAKSVYFDWSWQETRRIATFLWGTDEDVQKSINIWTANFLAVQAHAEKADEQEIATAE